MPLPRFLAITKLTRAATSMNMYYRKSAALVFILCQEASKQPVSSVVTGEDPA